MSFYSGSSHITWLAAALAGQRNRIVVLLRRLTGLGVRGAMNPSVFKKFLHMLDQVAVAREKEIRILNRIEAVEAEHRFRLTHNQLEPPIAANEEKASPACADRAEAVRPCNGLLWLLAFWYLFVRGAINQKKQGLTVN